MTNPWDRAGLERYVSEERRNTLDGALEYDAEEHWLTYTEYLGEEHMKWGATEIVARDVRPWFGLRVVALFDILAADSTPRLVIVPPPSLLHRLLRWVGR